MAVLVLSTANSLNPGADLWVTPQIEQSRNTQRLDWYLNFQISKAVAHKPKALAKELVSIIDACNLEQIQNQSADEQGLLIFSAQLLPAKWILVQPIKNDLQNWAQKIFHSWKQLQGPSLRVFLPNQKSATEFQSYWSQLAPNESYGIVVETQS